jgi:GntR family transcriptional repressor for pyruvate dehydrogenase complex
VAVASEEPTVRFAEVPRGAVTGGAMALIKEMILRGELRAGQRLPPEHELAAQLGVSRPTLREVMRALIALNILESRHGLGTFVSSLEPEKLAEPLDFVLQVSDTGLLSLLEARTAIESAVSGLAAERASAEDARELSGFAERGVGVLGDQAAFLEYDTEFHDVVRGLARSPILGSLMMSLRAMAMETRRRTTRSTDLRKRVLDDHRAIADAIQAHDSERARLTMATHLGRLRDFVESGQVDP